MNFLTQYGTLTPLLTQLGRQSFELQTRTSMSPSNSLTGSFPTLAIIALLSFILVLFLMTTLWPREKSNSMHSRQRQFGRVDGLFFRVQAALLDDEESERYMSGQLSNPVLLQGILMMKSQPLTLVSLSVGGCAFISHSPFKKGSILLLQLGSLPDFPKENLLVASKVIWTRTDKGKQGGIENSGCKFIYPTGVESPDEQLKNYISFLMDEPVS